MKLFARSITRACNTRMHCAQSLYLERKCSPDYSPIQWRPSRNERRWKIELIQFTPINISLETVQIGKRDAQSDGILGREVLGCGEVPDRNISTAIPRILPSFHTRFLYALIAKM